MTPDYNERTRLIAFSQFMGQMAWMIVPWFWVMIADPDLFETQAEGQDSWRFMWLAHVLYWVLFPDYFVKVSTAPILKIPLKCHLKI